MIRAATHLDAPEIETMIRELHQASKYAGRADVSDKALGSLVINMLAMQGQNGPQASMVVVAEEKGRIVGFMAGTLDRLYFMLNKLVAQDLFLYVRPRNGVRHSLELIDAYVEWASANPKVLEIKLSWNDALPRAAVMSTVYRRKGFDLVGEIFERRCDIVEEAAA